MNDRVGIVIKKYFPFKRTIVLLDQEHGKVECVPPHEDICCGMLLYYTAQKAQQTIFIRDMEKIELPLCFAQRDLLFFHHILELCYYYIPPASDSTQIFKVLIFLYTITQNHVSLYFKKIFLIKLFMELGLYPEDVKLHAPYFHTIAVTSIDILVQHNLDLKSERDLDVWLSSCISTHPELKHFKTIYFLDESMKA